MSQQDIRIPRFLFRRSSKSTWMIWLSSTHTFLKCSLNSLNKRYDFPHLLKPVIILIKPLCLLAISLLRYMSRFITITISNYWYMYHVFCLKSANFFLPRQEQPSLFVLLVTAGLRRLSLSSAPRSRHRCFASPRRLHGEPPRPRSTER